MTSFKPVAAVVRGLAVLKAVSTSTPATVGSIHAQTGIDKATIVRMLETLQHQGYVVRNEENSQYQLTGRCLLLSSGYDRLARMGDLADPILAEFRTRMGWPSDLAVRDRDAMILVQSSRKHGPLSFNRNPGYRAPIFRTSIGQAYLAFCESAERQEIVELLRRQNVIWDPSEHDGDTLDRRVERVRQQGYSLMEPSYSQSEYGGLVWAMAVPIVSGNVIHGSINIMMLTSAMKVPQGTAEMLGPLKETAQRLALAFDKDRR